MRRVHTDFAERFAPFKDEPWFDALFDAYEYAQHRDDEFTIDDIQNKLIATAKKQGIVLPFARCGWCQKPRADVVHCGAQCRICKSHEQRRKRAERRWRVRQARWLKTLSPEERAEYFRRNAIDFGSLFSRDVQ